MALVTLAGVLALLSFFSGVALLRLADGRFDARIAARAPRRAEPTAGLDMAPALTRLLGRWGEKAGRGAVEQDRRAALKIRLVRAGFYSDRAVEVFFGLRVASAAAMGALALGAAFALRLHGLAFLLVLATGANLGLFLPNVVLGRRIAERRRAMKFALPDAIDLMIVSVEAGVALGAALQRVAAEFADLHPIIAEQFGLMLMEMQAGASRAEALTRLAHRSPSDEVGALTSMIIQSEAVGASLGGALRSFAEELRKMRHLEAERRAAELPVKIAFPLVFCIFPAMTGVLFTPVLIRMLRMAWHG
jgi:tight adherence protein C